MLHVGVVATNDELYKKGGLHALRDAVLIMTLDLHRSDVAGTVSWSAVKSGRKEFVQGISVEMILQGELEVSAEANAKAYDAATNKVS